MQIDSSLGTTLPLTELGLLIEVACNRRSLSESSVAAQVSKRSLADSS